MTPTVLVTGAARGIGRACVDGLLEAGWRVVAGVRDPDAAGLPEAPAHRLVVTTLDVSDPTSVIRGVAAAERAAGGALDAVVNNAGYAVMGAIEDVDLDEVRAMFATNLFGALAVLQAAVPAMREAGRGVVVNVSSIGARFANPLLGAYHASKAALSIASEALALECKPHGLRVVNVEPGMVGTGFAAAVRRTGSAPTGEGPYAELAGEIREGFGAWRQRYEIPPDDVARAVVRAVTDPSSPFRVTVGDDAALLARTRASVDDATWQDALIDFLRVDSLGRARTQ